MFDRNAAIDACTNTSAIGVKRRLHCYCRGVPVTTEHTEPRDWDFLGDLGGFGG